MQVFVATVCLLITRATCEHLENYDFPEDFKFGVATSAYQIEGAWNEGGKSESIWDRYSREHPELIRDRSNGNIACDAYHHTTEDVGLIKDMGVQFYRFSLAWTRILPTGYSNYVNPEGIRYYNDLIDQLLAKGIEPMVTLYHWDLPQSLQEIGGWPNTVLAEHFENYARVAFENFGDRVKTWITFNEPKFTCMFGYGGFWLPPGYVNASGVADYMCSRTILLAHARAYHLYDKHYRKVQKGKVGLSLDTEWFIPNTTSPGDLEAARRMTEFDFGWFANPIYSKVGDFPQIMKDRIARRSTMEGFSKSRLPAFTQEEIESIKGSADFFGFNHYSASLVKDSPEPTVNVFSYENDLRVERWKDEKWPILGSYWLAVVPEGFRQMLKYIKETYNDPEIYVTENGASSLPNEILDDTSRSDYIKEYLSALLEAVYLDGVNVNMYAAWTLMDDFEWVFGYEPRFGFYHVNFTDPKRTRTPKTSVKVYKQIIKDRSLNRVLKEDRGKLHHQDL